MTASNASNKTTLFYPVQCYYPPYLNSDGQQFYQYQQNKQYGNTQKVRKSNKLEFFGSRKTKSIIPDIQDRLKLIMHEGDLPLVLINNIIDKNMHL